MGKINKLAPDTLDAPGEAETRKQLNEPWQKVDFKEIPADLTCFKNIENILR